jgi:hypothetical protein
MPIDPDKVFGLFGGKGGLDPKESNYVSPTSSPKIDYDDPLTMLKMFKKMIMNYTSYNKGLTLMFKQVDPKLDVKEIEKAGEAMLYERAYAYISKFKVKDKKSQEVLTSYMDGELEVAFKLTIKYFEEIEEYEKCALLKKIFDLSSK